MAPHTGVQNSKAHEPFNDTTASNGQVVEMALNVAKFSRIPEGVTKSGMRMYIRPSKSWILNLGSAALEEIHDGESNCNSLGNSVFYTHTPQRGEGRKEGTWTASDKQQQENSGKHNKGREQAGEHTSSRQSKGKGKGREGGRKHTEPNPGRQKSKSAKQNRQQSKTTQQRDNWSVTAKGRNKHTPGGRGREGTGRVGRGEKAKGKKETGKEGRGCPKRCVLRPWTHQGKRKVHPAILVYPRSHQRRGEGGKERDQHLMLRVLLRLVATRKNFAHRATPPFGCQDCHIVWSWLLAFEMQTASGCWRHPTLITGKCPAIIFIHVET